MKNIHKLLMLAMIGLYSCQNATNRDELLDKRERELVQRENELLLQKKQDLERKEMELMAREEELSNTQGVENNGASEYYAQGQGEYPIASEKLLGPGDIYGMTGFELTIMRNEIFARHGYAFKTQWLLDHFNKYPWYRALYPNVGGQLSEIEKKNIHFILENEKE